MATMPYPPPAAAPPYSTTPQPTLHQDPQLGLLTTPGSPVSQRLHLTMPIATSMGAQPMGAPATTEQYVRMLAAPAAP
eukprot:598354-Prymnesium_polylepis.1